MHHAHAMCKVDYILFTHVTRDNDKLCTQIIICYTYYIVDTKYIVLCHMQIIINNTYSSIMWVDLENLRETLVK